MTLTRLTLFTLGLSLIGGVALAKSSFKTKVPNGSVYGCTTCHTKTSPPAAWNAFGLDLKATLSGNAPDWAAVCGMDSDGDGWTNGEELQDPGCEWSPGDPNPGSAADVTKPGDASDFPPEPEPEPDVIEEGDVIDEADVPGPEEDVSEPGPEEDVSEPEEDVSAVPMDVEPDVQECGSTEDCPEGYGCNDGSCYPWDNVPECTDDSDCGEGQVCEWIDSVSSECVPGGSSDPPNDPSCTSDSDCGEAQTCVSLDDDTSECQDIVCDSDADCPGAFECLFPEDEPNFCQPTGMPSDDPDPIPSNPDDPGASSGGSGGGGGCQTTDHPAGRHLALLALLGLAVTLRRRTRLA